MECLFEYGTVVGLEQLPFDSIQHVDEVMRLIDDAVVSAVNVSSWMKPGITLDNQRVLQETLGQWTRDSEDETDFNREVGKLPRDMQTFQGRSRELAVAQVSITQGYSAR